MTGKQIIETAAKRLADEELDASIVETVAMIKREFAPFAELIEAARELHRNPTSTYPGHAKAWWRFEAALAEAEKMGGG